MWITLRIKRGRREGEASLLKVMARLLPLVSLFHCHPHRVNAQQLTTLLRTLACRDRMARIALCGWALALAVLSTAALPERANAQTFTATKMLCGNPPSGFTPAGNCPLTIVSLGQTVYYVITVTGLPNASVQNITLTETYPPGFTATANIVCTDQATNNQVSFPPMSTSIGTVSLLGGHTVTCVIAGWFNDNKSFTAPNSQTNSVTVSSDSGYSISNLSAQTYVAVATPLGAHLQVTKTESPTSPINVAAGPQLVTYFITVKNTTATSVYIPNNFVLHDTLSSMSGSVPLCSLASRSP